MNRPPIVPGRSIACLVLAAAATLFPMVYLLFQTKEKGYYANLLIVQGAMIGAVSATDMVLYYVFWEVMLLPVFFMIGLYGGPKRLPATIKITIYTIAGSLLMLDHVYAEYADEDLTARALEHDNVVVLRTFSKAWGLAGLRAGYGLAGEADGLVTDTPGLAVLGRRDDQVKLNGIRVELGRPADAGFGLVCRAVAVGGEVGAWG